MHDLHEPTVSRSEAADKPKRSLSERAGDAALRIKAIFVRANKLEASGLDSQEQGEVDRLKADAEELARRAQELSRTRSQALRLGAGISKVEELDSGRKLYPGSEENVTGHFGSGRASVKALQLVARPLGASVGPNGDGYEILFAPKDGSQIAYVFDGTHVTKQVRQTPEARAREAHIRAERTRELQAFGQAQRTLEKVPGMLEWCESLFAAADAEVPANDGAETPEFNYVGMFGMIQDHYSEKLDQETIVSLKGRIAGEMARGMLAHARKTYDVSDGAHEILSGWQAEDAVSAFVKYQIDNLYVPPAPGGKTHAPDAHEASPEDPEEASGDGGLEEVGPA